MSFCLADLHLWSSKSTLHVRDTDIGTYQYYDKGEPVNLTDHHYFSEKQDFVESRGLHWTPKNSRPEKLRDSLKELEELLQAGPCVCSRWRNKQSCQMLLGSGVLVTLSLSGPQLERVNIDRALVGRLAADTISDAVITDRFLLLTFVEKNKVCLVHLAARRGQSSPDLNRRVEKLSLSELKISCADLPGPAGRRLGRRVGLNCLQDVAICWWPAVNEEAWPWSPVPSEGDRANLVLLACSGAGGLKVLSCIRTEGDPLDCRFSLSQPYQVLTVEVGARETAADSCVYECARRHLQRLAVTRLPLSARPVCCCRDPAESKLLLGLQDSSLVLWDGRRGLSLLAQAPMLPSLLAWHPGGALLLVGGGQGELQCFDAGLSPVALQLLAEDPNPGPALRLSQHLRAAGGLAGMQWAAPPPGAEGLEVQDLLFLTFHGGPVGVLRFRLGALNGGQLGPVELIQQRLRCGEVEESLGLLGAMDWSTMGAECYRALTAIADHLLRLELNAEREAQLEAALGMFYAPSRPLSDTVVLEYRDPISKYARRFFHHLLRYQRFEKAFLLAVDIGARDLFMDIHYVACDKGELVLADVARKRANEIDAESITTGPGEPQWSDTCDPAPDPAPLDRRTGRRWDEQVGWRAQPRPGDGTGHTPSSSRSQDGLASRAAGGGQLSRAAEEVFSRTVPSDQTWDWRQTEVNLEDNDDQVSGEAGTLKVVHFGLV